MPRRPSPRPAWPDASSTHSARSEEAAVVETSTCPWGSRRTLVFDNMPLRRRAYLHSDLCPARWENGPRVQQTLRECIMISKEQPTLVVTCKLSPVQRLAVAETISDRARII